MTAAAPGSTRPPRVGDLVSMTDPGGHLWSGGLVTAITDRIYVRWPDGIVGQFDRRHARRLIPESS